MAYTFMCIASKDLVMPKSRMFLPQVIKIITALHKENPDKHFLFPSISNYTLLQYDQNAFPAHFGYWENQCKTFIDSANEVMIIPTTRWFESEGVIKELLYANSIGKRIVVDRNRIWYDTEVYAFAEKVAEVLNA